MDLAPHQSDANLRPLVYRHSRAPDSGPHQSDKLDPYPDPHQSGKLGLDPDPQQFADDMPKCMEYELLSTFLRF